MSFILVIAVTIVIFATLTVALNLVVGYAGQPNLAQSAFFGIGAYFAAVMSTRYHLTFWWTIPIALGVSGTAGFVLGAISLRLREDFLAITTIGLNFVVVAVFQYVPFFGGAVGIYAIPLPAIGAHTFGNVDFLVAGVAMLAFTVGTSAWLERSWIGGCLVAIRDDENAASSVGIPVATYKVIAFTLSAALAGMAGSLYAPFMSAVTPTTFGFTESVVILAMLIFGGVGKIRGALLGALILGALPEVFRFISNFRLLTFGAILLLMLRFQPQGLAGDESAASNLMAGIMRAFTGSRPSGPGSGRGGDERSGGHGPT